MANQSTPVIQIKDSNVGIGTSTPSYKLQVIGGQFGTLLKGGDLGTGSDVVRMLKSDDSIAMLVRGDGGVGINTATINNKLVVASNATYNDENTYSIAASALTDPAYKTVLGYDYSNDVGVIAAVRQSVAWKNLSLPQGNFLIGTTTDLGFKLTVAGNAFINNVTIGTDGTYGNPYRVVAFGSANDGANRIFAANDTADGMYFASATGRGFVWRPNGGTTQRMGLDSTGVFSTLGPTLGSTAGNQAYNAIFDLSNGNSSILEIKDVRTANGSDWTFAGKRLQMRIDSTYMGYIQFNGNSNNAGMSFGTGATTDAPGNVSTRMIISSGGEVSIANNAGNGGVSTNFRAYAYDSDSYFRLGNNSSNSLDMELTRSDAATMFSLNGHSGIAYFAGNVLIGTTTDAGYKLDVNGTLRSQGSLYTAGRQYIQVSGNTLVAYKIPYNGLSNVGGTTVSDSQASDGTAMVRYSNEGNNTFFYGPYTTLEPGNYVAKFRIKVASNASASYIGYIDVSGANVNGTDISLRPNMFPTGGDYYYIDVPFICNGSASSIEFRWIDWRGGITDTYLDHILVTSQAQANNVYVQDGGSYTIYEAQLPRLKILNGSGNVGIGTDSPSEKLDIIDGKLRFTNTSSGRNSTIGMDDSYNLYVKNTPIGNLYIGNGTTTYVTGSFNAGGGSVQIPSGGNVIIGSTTDAGYKLDVHGEILGRDDIRILNTFALILNGTDPNWRIGRNTITDSGWLTSNTLQIVIFGGESGQGFQVVNTNGTALFEIDGVAGASRFTNALGVGVNPSGTAGRIDASNDIVAYSSSDLRLKENIKPIENALDKVKALTGVEFDWKAEHKEAHGYEGHDTGVIAQEVQEVMPTAVRTNDTGYLAVRYEKLIGLLIEANKELANRVEYLESKLK